MPRNVRNFWLSLEVDGKKARVETGPVSKYGGFDLVVKIREKDGISNRAVRLFGLAGLDGKLRLEAQLLEKGAIKTIYKLDSER